MRTVMAVAAILLGAVLAIAAHRLGGVHGNGAWAIVIHAMPRNIRARVKIQSGKRALQRRDDQNQR